MKSAMGLFTVMVAAVLGSCELEGPKDEEKSESSSTGALVLDGVTYTLGQACLTTAEADGEDFSRYLEVRGPDVEVAFDGATVGGVGVVFGFHLTTSTESPSGTYTGDTVDLQPVQNFFGGLYDSEGHYSDLEILDQTASYTVTVNVTDDSLSLEGTFTLSDGTTGSFSYEGSYLTMEL